VPEGPEIRVAADEIAAAIEGERVQVRFSPPKLRHFGPLLSGARVLRVHPRGKALLIEFEHGHTIYSHNQLYGRWYVVPAGERPVTGRALRLTIAARDRHALLYSASDIEVLKSTALGQHPYLSRLGPDLLDPATGHREVLRRIDDPRFGGRRLADLLLDQGFLAGIGNYLRSEILFVAGLRPELRLGQLRATERNRLTRAALTLTRRSYHTGGITNDPARAKSLASRGWSYDRYRHHVFDREGEACHRCGGTIRRIDVAGRAIYLCEVCQSSEPQMPNHRRNSRPNSSGSSGRRRARSA
jgi:endonuclease-8